MYLPSTVRKICSKLKSAVGALPLGVLALISFESLDMLAFYAVRSMLVFYMMDAYTHGGLSMSKDQAIGIMSNFSTVLLLSSIFLGPISDFIGRQKSLFFGAIFITLGYYLLSFQRIGYLYMYLILATLSFGLIKTSITSVISDKCSDFKKKEKHCIRDLSFSVFYMITNIGVAIGVISMSYGIYYFGYKSLFSTLSIVLTVGIVILSLAINPKILLSREVSAEISEKKNFKNNNYSEKFNKKKFLCLVLMCVMSTYFYGIESFESSLVVDWIHNNVISFVPATVYQSFNPIVVISCALIVQKLIDFLKRKKIMTSNMTPLVISQALLILGCASLSLMQYRLKSGMEVGAFFPCLYYVLSALGEIFQKLIILPYLILMVPNRHQGKALSFFFGMGALGVQIAKGPMIKSVLLNDLTSIANYSCLVGFIILVILFLSRNYFKDCFKD